MNRSELIEWLDTIEEHKSYNEVYEKTGGQIEQWIRDKDINACIHVHERHAYTWVDNIKIYYTGYLSFHLGHIIYHNKGIGGDVNTVFYPYVAKDIMVPSHINRDDLDLDNIGFRLHEDISRHEPRYSVTFKEHSGIPSLSLSHFYTKLSTRPQGQSHREAGSVETFPVVFRIKDIKKVPVIEKMLGDALISTANIPTQTKRASRGLDGLSLFIEKHIKQSELNNAQQKEVWESIFSTFESNPEQCPPIIRVDCSIENSEKWVIYHETDSLEEKSLRWSGFKKRIGKIKNAQD